MTPDQLSWIMPGAVTRAATFAKPLTDAMVEFDITTPKQQAAFLAQIAQESGELRYTRELADGVAYEFRTDLGNTEPGDGPRYKGRGLLQITGRVNYSTCGTALHLDLIGQPELLEKPEAACRSAGWYWKSRNLNACADRDEFGTLTKRINGGFNGIDARIIYWLSARRILGIT